MTPGLPEKVFQPCHQKRYPGSRHAEEIISLSYVVIPDMMEGIAGKREVQTSLLKLLSCNSVLDKQKKMVVVQEVGMIDT